MNYKYINPFVVFPAALSFITHDCFYHYRAKNNAVKHSVRIDILKKVVYENDQPRFIGCGKEDCANKQLSYLYKYLLLAKAIYVVREWRYNNVDRLLCLYDSKEVIGLIRVNLVQEIYSRLMDETSKKIFEKRLMYSISREPHFIRDIIEDLPEGKSFVKEMEISSENYLFGAGAWGKELAYIWGGWKGFLDNNVNILGKEIAGLPVLFPADVNSHNQARIFVSTRLYYKEIVDQLLNIGVKEENIVNVGEVLDEMSKKQYFDLQALPHDQRECFCDVGSFDGKTSLRFMEWSQKWEHIYCFEADPNNVSKIQKTLHFGDKVTIIEKAAWSQAGMIGFYAKGNGSSGIDARGDILSATTLDSEMQDKRITFIKMDIEGAENEALTGAKKIIQEQTPKLAIAVYHKEEDILSVLEKIMEYNPRYKFYLRHYSLTDSETVLYAI